MLVIVFIVYMSSSYVARMEIGALIPYILGILFILGMIIGDISYFIQTDAQEFKDLNISNPFVVGD